MPGSATSAAEVTDISQHGFLMLIDGREFFVDVDLALDSIEHPERYPLTSQL